MGRRLENYLSQARFYADQAKQARALKEIPEELVNQPLDYKLVRKVLHWFKGSFFRWTDSPVCSKCGDKASTNEGMVEASDDELRYGATRVEAWRCAACDVVVRFPRYNDPEHLLTTRNGRCGEWANCFTLCTSALGFESRLVVDWTDHVWTELLLEDKWTHCDPCESCLDAPLTYEAGWGKKLTYIFAFGPCEVVDVAPRYTREWTKLLERRTAVTEETLTKIVTNLDSQARLTIDLPIWRESESKELVARRTAPASAPQGAELLGRTSGSAKWRKERGEMGNEFTVLSAEPGSIFVCAGSMSRTSMDGSRDADVHVLGMTNLRSETAVPFFDFSGEGAGLEINGPTGTPCCDDAFLSQHGFTIEVWVQAQATNLHYDAFRNPVVSRHGPASGWEIRLCREGGFIFLVTMDGTHLETPCSQGMQLWDGTWQHIACMLHDDSLVVSIKGDQVVKATVAKGPRNSFPGPICIARNPVWRDRGACCQVHAVRITPRKLDHSSFLLDLI